MRKAVYAGSFDPVTQGHLWVIEQAANLFDELVIAVAQNVGKNYSFSLSERLHLLKKVTTSLSNVTISEVHNEFLIRYAKRIDAQFIVRGIRNSNDYEYEKRMRYVNSDICTDITTIFLIPPRDVAEISSSLVKGLVGSDGWEEIIQKYVPPAVAEKMIASKHA